MEQPARLITPDGKTIVLPAEVYRQVKQLLDTRPKRKKHSSHGDSNTLIQAGYGMLASKESLTKALLDERAAEKAREDKKLSRWKG